MNQPSGNSDIVVRITLGGEECLTTEAEWSAKADELVAKYGGVPKVVRLHRDSLTTVQPVIEATSALVPKIVAKPEVVRGKTVDLEGAIRSGMDFEGAVAAGFAPAQTLYTRGTMVVDDGVRNARRSRLEHDKKPLVTDYCTDLIQTVHDEDRCEWVVPATSLRMTKNGRLGAVHESDTLLTTPRALKGLATRLGYGGGSYLEKCWPDLRCVNFNNWGERLQAEEIEKIARIQQETGKVREPALMKLRHRKNVAAKDREVFGVVTDSYTDFDVDKIAEALRLATPKDARGTVTYNGYKARFEIVFHSHLLPEKYVAGEFFRAAVIINTDDTGSGSIRGMSSVEQNLCLNLLIIDRATRPAFAIRHSGSVAELARKFREGFDLALGRLDYFLKAWNYAVEEDVVAEVRAAEKNSLPADGKEIMQGIFNALLYKDMVPVPGRRKEIVPQLMKMWEEDKSAAHGFTRAAVVNAFTRYAHKVNDDVFAEDEIQEAAGQLLYGRKDNQFPTSLPYEPFEPKKSDD